MDSKQEKKTQKSKNLSYQKNKDNQCHICSKKFIKPCSLKFHYRSQHGFLPYACDRCPKVYSKRYDLDKHKLLDHFNFSKQNCEDLLPNEYHNQYFPSQKQNKQQSKSFLSNNQENNSKFLSRFDSSTCSTSQNSQVQDCFWYKSRTIINLNEQNNQKEIESSNQILQKIKNPDNDENYQQNSQRQTVLKRATFKNINTSLKQKHF